MPLTTQYWRRFILLMLVSLLPSWGLAADGADPALDKEIQQLRTSTQYPDILRLSKLQYPKQPEAWHEFWAHVAADGLKEVVPGVTKQGKTHEQLFLAGVRLMASADHRQNPSGAYRLTKFIEDGILKADSPYVRRLRPIAEEIDRKGQAHIAELDRQIAESDRQIAEYRKISDFWKGMAERFENLK